MLALILQNLKREKLNLICLSCRILHLKWFKGNERSQYSRCLEIKAARMHCSKGLSTKLQNGRVLARRETWDWGSTKSSCRSYTMTKFSKSHQGQDTFSRPGYLRARPSSPSTSTWRLSRSTSLQARRDWRQSNPHQEERQTSRHPPLSRGSLRWRRGTRCNRGPSTSKGSPNDPRLASGEGRLT